MKQHFGFFLLSLALASCSSEGLRLADVERWTVLEMEWQGPSEGNPYMEVDLWATFVHGEDSIRVPGFYDGDGRYFVRFSPGEEGNWEFRTESNAEALHGKAGAFACVPASGDNHGPLEIVNTFYLQYADGSPFYSVGTTAYQWTSVKQSIQEQTLETLAEAPFNKMRMCVFPKYYALGNVSEPWLHPYERNLSEQDTLTGTVADFTRPRYAFFQNLDRRVEHLLEMGIQADVILFHCYDIWGYFRMGPELNERYVRYMIARLSAYRNVWWSLANEWDIPELKVAIDWEGVGMQLQGEDPHQRFRGIHNWWDNEEHFYDHHAPWITHASIQSNHFHKIREWRERYRKPILMDEMRYEGTVEYGWGNMSGEEMASYFWMAGLSGAYGTHGEVHVNPADDSSEVRWWGKGGKLVGTSVERIAWFRELMEELPVKDMEPVFVPHGEPRHLESNVHILKKEGAFYLAYVADPWHEIQLELGGNRPYLLQVMDTWNMLLLDSLQVEPGAFSYTPENPYSLLLLEVK